MSECRAWHCGLPVLLLLLAGCGASSPPHYYSLSGPLTTPAQPATARILVDLLPITVPQRVDRNALVLIGEDGALDIRSSERWAAPLADEIRQVVADGLWQRLQAVDVYQTPLESALPHFRLSVRIERFDATPGKMAVIDAAWTLRRLPDGVGGTCRATVAAQLGDVSPSAATSALATASRDLAGKIAGSFPSANGGLDCGTLN